MVVLVLLLAVHGPSIWIILFGWLAVGFFAVRASTGKDPDF